MDHAATWDDVEYALARDGLTLEAKGHGLVAGNSAGYVKFSALGLTASATALERRFGTTYAAAKATRRPPTRRPAGRRSIWAVDAIDIARAIGDRDDVRDAVHDARKQRLARRAKLALMQQLMAELAEELQASTSLKQRSTSKRPRGARSAKLDRSER